MAAKYITMLRSIRKATGKKSAHAALEMGVNPKTYSTWETGRVQIGSDKVYLLCDFFGCTPNDLFGFTRASSFIEATLDEQALIDLWRSLTPNKRDLAMELLQNLANS